MLYAPTWEGGRAEMAYGSSESQRCQRCYVASLRLVVRPHSRTGIHLREHKYAVKMIYQLIKLDNKANPSMGHHFDERREPALAIS